MRPTIDVNKRKQPISLSLLPSDIVILDNLAKASKKNRSQVVQEMLRAKGFKDLGLKATEKHMSPRQRWNGSKTRDLGACNPMHIDGKCQHPSCQAVYKKEGLL